ncbi:MAG: SPOR domain-containing protein [Campylobacterales bacterium]|nr:SPOR domain-containing protein [Campylobacterales bacterium]
MNNIYRIVLFFLLFLSSLGASFYDVQLGSFRNYNGLTASLSKIKNDTYKHKISIEQKGDLFYVYSRGYDNNAEAQNALHFYKKIFKDAFIKETVGNISHRSSYHQTISQKQSWQNTYARSSPIQNVSTKLPNRKQNFSFADQLKRKVFYLCYEGKKREWSNL